MSGDQKWRRTGLDGREACSRTGAGEGGLTSSPEHVEIACCIDTVHPFSVFLAQHPLLWEGWWGRLLALNVNPQDGFRFGWVQVRNWGHKLPFPLDAAVIRGNSAQGILEESEFPKGSKALCLVMLPLCLPLDRFYAYEFLSPEINLHKPTM